MYSKILALLIVLVAIVSGQPVVEQANLTPDNDTRIIGGYPAGATQFPFVISLQTALSADNNAKFCGGSIIHNEWILTAAHCLYNPLPGPLHINAGSLNAFDYSASQKISVENYFIHPGYNPTLYQNDIALIKLAKPLEYTQTVQPIEIAGESHDPLTYGIGRVMGWGATHPVYHTISSDNLMYADIEVLPNDDCKKSFNTVGNNQLCVQNRYQLSGPCSGDSGGPFIQYVDEKPVLVGLTSYAIKVCSITPTVYTRIGPFYEWILNTMHQYTATS